MNMAGFQVEQILSQLKELRQEKSRNEHLLKLLQQERRNLESKVEAGILSPQNKLMQVFH
jgi:flagellar biosynthesis chaperone FliJ